MLTSSVTVGHMVVIIHSRIIRGIERIRNHPQTSFSAVARTVKTLRQTFAATGQNPGRCLLCQSSAPEELSSSANSVILSPHSIITASRREVASAFRCGVICGESISKFNAARSTSPTPSKARSLSMFKRRKSRTISFSDTSSIVSVPWQPIVARKGFSLPTPLPICMGVVCGQELLRGNRHDDNSNVSERCPA